jgi:hypothetical protein
MGSFGWSRGSSLLLALAICLLVLPGRAAAFGAGNIPSIAQVRNPAHLLLPLWRLPHCYSSAADIPLLATRLKVTIGVMEVSARQCLLFARQQDLHLSRFSRPRVIENHAL